MIVTTVYCDAGPESIEVAAESLDHARQIAASHEWRCDGWELCPEHKGLTDEQIRLRCPL